VLSRDEALREFGLGVCASAGEVRDAYRRLARELHPDRPGAPADATDRMARLNEAYARLSAAPASTPAEPVPPSRAAAPSRDAEPVDVALDADGALYVSAPADETFLRLLDAADAVGDATYVDRDAALLQVIVHHPEGTWSYVTFSLQGRATGTEVFATLDTIDGHAAPALRPVLETLVTALRGAPPADRHHHRRYRR